MKAISAHTKSNNSIFNIQNKYSSRDIIFLKNEDSKHTFSIPELRKTLDFLEIHLIYVIWLDS